MYCYKYIALHNAMLIFYNTFIKGFQISNVNVKIKGQIHLCRHYRHKINGVNVVVFSFDA